MNEGQVDDLAGDLVRIHRAITRGFLIAADASHNFARNGFADEDLKQGFLNYVRAHVTILTTHHQAEDVAFPQLRQRLPDAPYEELLAEHKVMQPYLDQIRLALADIRVGLHVKESLEVLIYTLNKNRELWRPHIYTEEQHFNSAALNAAFEPTEQLEVRRGMAQHSMQNARPEYLVLPFVLYNLSGADRAVFKSNLPSILAERVHGEWKGMWRTMMPFLLA